MIAAFLSVGSAAAGSDDGTSEHLKGIRAAGNLANAMEALSGAEQELSQAEAIEAYRHVGTVAELFGDLEASLDLYTRSSDLGDEESGLRAAAILFELGRIAEAEAWARRLVLGAESYSIRRRATAILARAMAATGRSGQAIGLLLTVASIDDAKHLEPEVLYLLYRLSEREGNAEAMSSSRERLMRLFPDSVEAILLEGNAQELIIVTPSLPDLLASSPAVIEDEKRGEPAAAGPGDRNRNPGATAEQAIGVQTGSFQDSGNADYMARDLRALGFSVDVLTTARAESELHRVVVKRKTDQTAQEVLIELKSRGIEGFLVF